MRTLGIDCRFAATSTGLSRYTRELVAELAVSGDMRVVLFVRSLHESWIPTHSTATVVAADFPPYSLAEHLRFPSLIRSAKCDVLFVPHFNAPWFSPVPTIITVHDLILHRYSNHAGWFKRFAYRMLMRHAVRQARSIICVSNFTQSELKRAYGDAIAQKSTIIHEAVSSFFVVPPESVRLAVREQYGLDKKPYFLYVGNCKQHKNVGALIDAWMSLQDSSRELVFVTGGKEAAHVPEIAGMRVLRGVPDADLPALYAGALCFVSASLYEGFGLPLWESHACGCPAIVSNRASFPEIAPPGTVLCEPTAEAFAVAMRSPPQWVQGAKQRRWEHVAAETEVVLGEGLE